MQEQGKAHIDLPNGNRGLETTAADTQYQRQGKRTIGCRPEGYFA